MVDGRLDARAIKRVSGPSWQMIRPKFDHINDILLAVSRTAHGVLTTVYIKYVDETKIGSQPFAVVWVKKSSELVVGLAHLEDIQISGVTPEMHGYKYANLTRVFVVDAKDDVPEAFREWSIQAYEHTKVRYNATHGLA